MIPLLAIRVPTAERQRGGGKRKERKEKKKKEERKKRGRSGEKERQAARDGDKRVAACGSVHVCVRAGATTR